MSDLIWHGRRVFTLATRENIEAMAKAANVVADDVKRNFTQQGSGAASKRTKSGKVHRASRPGQPPAIDTGNLRASIQAFVDLEGANVVGRVGPDVDYLFANTPVGTDVEYGYYLEVGTSKMSPRPYLRPALKRTRQRVNKIFETANK